MKDIDRLLFSHPPDHVLNHDDGNMFVALSQLSARVSCWEDMVSGLLQLSLSYLHAHYGWFSLYDEHSDSMRIDYLSGISREVIQDLNMILTTTSMKGEVFVFNDLQNMFPEERKGFPSALICYPFFSGQRFIGSLFLCKKAPGKFDESDRNEMEALCYFCSKMVENAMLFRNLKQTQSAMNTLIEKIHMLEKIKTHLSKFVPTSVIQLIEESPENPKFDKVNRDVSVLFLDIAGYTRLNQELKPEDVNFIVETYFSNFLDDIYLNRGDINETAGDGLMILFLDNDIQTSALQAAQTACAIKNKIQFVEKNLSNPLSVKVNIGIDSGPALVGSVRFRGQSGDRWTFTASGMTTNISSRLTKYAKNGEILLSENTASLIKDRFPLNEIGSKRFKNVDHPVRIYSMSA